MKKCCCSHIEHSVTSGYFGWTLDAWCQKDTQCFSYLDLSGKQKKEKVKETYSDELVDYGSHADLQRIMTRLGKNEGFLPRLSVFSVRQWKIRGISCTKIRNRWHILLMKKGVCTKRKKRKANCFSDIDTRQIQLHKVWRMLINYKHALRFPSSLKKLIFILSQYSPTSL